MPQAALLSSCLASKPLYHLCVITYHSAPPHCLQGGQGYEMRVSREESRQRQDLYQIKNLLKTASIYLCIPLTGQWSSAQYICYRHLRNKLRLVRKFLFRLPNHQ